MRCSSFVVSLVMVTATLGVTLTSTGCPSSDDKVCSDYTPPAGFDEKTPVVSFREKVFPIFAPSCKFSTCHGNEFGDANGVYLGSPDPSLLRANLVDKPAPELSTMSFVKPGDWRNSYLMRKLDGTQCLLNAQCKDGDCGDSMPRGNDLIDQAVRDDVRRWIAQGALDN